MAGELKLAVVSHSLVARRQILFWTAVGLEGAKVLQVGPKSWGPHVNELGYEVENENDMAGFTFGQDALLAIEEYKPDVLYVQNEAYCAVTSQMRRLARRLGSKFVVFVWENLHGYQRDEGAQKNLTAADLVVCGNGAAESMVQPYNPETLRCIQVGVSPVFRPLPIRKDFEVIFQGRRETEKGVEVLEKALQGTSWKVLWPVPGFGTPYEELVYRYNRAKVIASPSIDTSVWKEQHGAYANLEALFCGLYVATSDSEAIVEGLSGCPGVFFAKQGDPVDLRAAVERFLGLNETNQKGAEWAQERYGTQAVKRRLLEAFGRL